MSAILYKELSYQLIGAAIEVHRLLGGGFLEKVYQASLAHELGLRHIPHEQYKALPIYYKDMLVGEYEADFVVAEQVILEIKAVSQLRARHEAQAHNYLAATRLRLAILLNLGGPSLQQKRVLR